MQQQQDNIYNSYLNYDVLSLPQLTQFQAEVCAGGVILKLYLQNTVNYKSFVISVPCHFTVHNRAKLAFV